MFVFNSLTTCYLWRGMKMSSRPLWESDKSSDALPSSSRGSIFTVSDSLGFRSVTAIFLFILVSRTLETSWQVFAVAKVLLSWVRVVKAAYEIHSCSFNSSSFSAEKLRIYFKNNEEVLLEVKNSRVFWLQKFESSRHVCRLYRQ